MSIDTRLPVPGQDNGNWGDILNEFLEVAHNTDGTVKPNAITQAGAVLTSQIGQPSGVAGLNNSGLVPTAKLATGTASSSNFLRGDGTWAVPTGTQGAVGADGPAGPTGDTGPQGPARFAAYASYYTNNSNPDPLGSGASPISFNTTSINAGSAVTVSGSVITISANGTYLLSVSGIVQEMLFETSDATSLSFTAGFASKQGAGSWVNIEPYPAVSHISWSPTDFSGNLTTASTSLNVSQMVSVTNAPTSFNLTINNSSSSYHVQVINPALNIIKLD